MNQVRAHKLNALCLTLSLGAALAVLAACGGQQFLRATPLPFSRSTQHSKTFKYRGIQETFQVPDGVTSLTVVASGASGSTWEGRRGGARGSRVKAIIPVTPGESLAIYVGGRGHPGDVYRHISGGFNGGGNSDCRGESCDPGGGGGGASDVREGGNALQNRVVVAAGGGGQGCCRGGNGGDGGRKVGANGAHGTAYSPSVSPGKGGKGGTQTAGGRGGKHSDARYYYCHGSKGSDGSLGVGGDGAPYCGNGGGGGGGYYGGGGGGSGCDGCGKHTYDSGAAGGGGGGGSSYVENAATFVKETKGGAAHGDGQIVLIW